MQDFPVAGGSDGVEVEGFKVAELLCCETEPSRFDFETLKL